MGRTETITMSMREIDRLKTVQAVADGGLKPMIAAARLGLTTRQVRRLVLRVRAEGARGLVSRKRGRTGNHQLQPQLANAALAIIQDRYADFGPTLACEKLWELHGIKIGKETVRRLMTEAGFWTPRVRRSAKIYQPRNRRQCIGELIQIDGSDHRWFEERGPACTLLVYIDDATSRLMHLYFTFSESTFSYFEATRAYLEMHGKPLAFYSDKATVFRNNQKDAEGGHGYTQFGRAMYDLNIDSICANTSEAKGRVERANLTLQDRLVKEMRLRNISTMAAGNEYAPTFIADFNKRFAKPPLNNFDVHRLVRPDEDLTLIFSVHDKRKMSSRLTLQIDHSLYMFSDTIEARSKIGKFVDVYEYPDGHIEVKGNGIALPYTIYDKLPVVNQGAIVDNKRLGHILRISQELQRKRDSRKGMGRPAHTNTGAASTQRTRKIGAKPVSNWTEADLVEAIEAANID